MWISTLLLRPDRRKIVCMIDLPTSKDMATPHHRKAIGALVATVIIFGLLLVVYYLRPEPVETPVQSNIIQQLVGQSVPPSNLTADETKKVQSLVGKPVPAGKLTPAQVKEIQAQVGQ